MISGIEFYREVSPATRMYMYGRASEAVQSVNNLLSGEQELGTPFIPSDLTVGSIDVGSLSQRGFEALQQKLEVDKHNIALGLRTHASSFEEDGELLEGVNLGASWFTRHRQTNVMKRALHAAGVVAPVLEVPEMRIIVARHMPTEPINMDMRDLVDHVSTHVASSIGLAHLDPIQARPVDDGTVIHVHFRSAS